MRELIWQGSIWRFLGLIVKEVKDKDWQVLGGGGRKRVDKYENGLGQVGATITMRRTRQ